jgi:hypothetical protein
LCFGLFRGEPEPGTAFHFADVFGLPTQNIWELRLSFPVVIVKDKIPKVEQSNLNKKENP